ncbi:MAG TPA: hypothetical protein VFK32_00065 [Tepidiformaceae bacterium]|nr:hypothetical protein [Tepidiformaceae bacterium]
MTRKRRGKAAPPPASPASVAAQPAFDRRSALLHAFSGGLGLRANVVLTFVGLFGLLLFVLNAVVLPDVTRDDGDAPPGPTVFPTATPPP